MELSYATRGRALSHSPKEMGPGGGVLNFASPAIVHFSWFQSSIDMFNGYITYIWDCCHGYVYVPKGSIHCQVQLVPSPQHGRTGQAGRRLVRPWPAGRPIACPVPAKNKASGIEKDQNGRESLRTPSLRRPTIASIRTGMFCHSFTFKCKKVIHTTMSIFQCPCTSCLSHIYHSLACRTSGDPGPQLDQHRGAQFRRLVST